MEDDLKRYILEHIRVGSVADKFLNKISVLEKDKDLFIFISEKLRVAVPGQLPRIVYDQRITLSIFFGRDLFLHYCKLKGMSDDVSKERWYGAEYKVADSFDQLLIQRLKHGYFCTNRQPDYGLLISIVITSLNDFDDHLKQLSYKVRAEPWWLKLCFWRN